jgi:geranylgeranyl pyrophosphate synthase
MAGVKAPSAGDLDFSVRWAALKAGLDHELARCIPDFFGSLGPGQVETISTILAGGKRIRGCLVCLVNEVLGGAPEHAMRRAAAIECIQAASLIHDDYVDEDTERRNRPATWAVEGPRKAVLLGDLIFATALEQMMRISQADGLAAAHAIATMANGAYLEPMDPADLARASAEGRYGPGLYDRIIHLKTGALFGAAARVGAIAARASEATRELAFEWGTRVGEAYQIADDLDDVVSLEATAAITPGTLSRLAPLFLSFSSGTGFRAAYLSAGTQDHFRQWLRTARPIMETRMRDEMDARLGFAAESAARLPEDVDTRVLRDAARAIAGMGTS